MLLAILSHVKSQWKVCYNKLKQGNFQKTDVGGESQDICQELAVTSGHTKLFFSKIFGRFLTDFEQRLSDRERNMNEIVT